MAAEEETSAKQAVSIPPGASRPAKSAVRTAVMSASCVSTSIVTRSAEAAKGMAKAQMPASLAAAPPAREGAASAGADTAGPGPTTAGAPRQTGVQGQRGPRGVVVAVVGGT